MTFRFMIAGVFFLGLLTACGNEGSSTSGTKDAEKKACSADYVSDFNDVATDFDIAVIRADKGTWQNLRLKVEDFQRKHSGVVCEASFLVPGKVDPVKKVVDTKEKTAEWLRLVDAEIAKFVP